MPTYIWSNKRFYNSYTPLESFSDAYNWFGKSSVYLLPSKSAQLASSHLIISVVIASGGDNQVLLLEMASFVKAALHLALCITEGDWN